MPIYHNIPYIYRYGWGGQFLEGAFKCAFHSTSIYSRMIM